MININNVYKYYDKACALDNITIDIQRGSICGIIGSNGAGKTTLLKLLSAIMQQDSGDIFFNGEKIYEVPGIKEKIFFIPDRPSFFNNYSIRNMADFYKGIYNNWNDKTFNSLCRLNNIEENDNINRLSKGLQRQAAFILALSTMPGLLIMDEPFNGLDIILRKKIKNQLINEVADRDMTVIISSHNVRELDDFCDNIIMLHKANVIGQMDIDTMISGMHKVQMFFKDKPAAEKTIGQLSSEFDVISTKQTGGSHTLIIKGDKINIEFLIQTNKPSYSEIMPLTLEEIFYYMLGGADL